MKHALLRLTVVAVVLLSSLMIIGFTKPGVSRASAASDQTERLRYANETLNLAYEQYVARQQDFRASGCTQVPPKADQGCTKPAPYNGFDWTDDGCSGRDQVGALSNIYRNLFNKPCRLHDFGYRNFGKGLTLQRTEAKRTEIDNRFKAEMVRVCNNSFPSRWQILNKTLCLREASAVYAFVHYLPGASWDKPLAAGVCCTPAWVPPSGSTSTPPTPPTAPVGSAQVQLSQGPAATFGYRYAVNLTGFIANASISITCYDSVSSAGFYTFALTTDGSGAASTAGYCYSGDGPDHWVIAGGVESNHVAWGASSPPPPPPAASPQINLAQGPAAPFGFRYAVTLSAFAPNSTITVTCHDSVDPGGFYTFTLGTDGNGGAYTASQCYSGDHPDHWVRASGLESNHVGW